MEHPQDLEYLKDRCLNLMVSTLRIIHHSRHHLSLQKNESLHERIMENHVTGQLTIYDLKEKINWNRVTAFRTLSFFFFFPPFRLFRDSCERSRRWILRRMNGQKKRRGLILDEGTKASSAWNKDSAVPHFMRFDRRRIERGCFTGWPAFLFLSLWKKEQEDAVKAEREIG